MELIAGSASGKRQSTTGPRTATILPFGSASPGSRATIFPFPSQGSTGTIPERPDFHSLREPVTESPGIFYPLTHPKTTGERAPRTGGDIHRSLVFCGPLGAKTLDFPVDLGDLSLHTGDLGADMIDLELLLIGLTSVLVISFQVFRASLEVFVVR